MEFNLIQNKISPNNQILLNGVLRPRLLNIPSASCSFINLDFYYRIWHTLIVTLFYHY